MPLEEILLLKQKVFAPTPRKSCTAYIERNATIAAFAVWPAGVGPALQLLYFFRIRRAAEDQSSISETRFGDSFR